MKISIDSGRCTGHGRCYAEAPELVTDDDRGYGQIKGDGELTAATLDAARRAVAVCPEQAVILAE